MNKNKKVFLGVILGVIVLIGIVIAAITVNSRIQEENAAIKAKKERIAKEEAAAAAQKQLVEDFNNIYSSLGNFGSITSEVAKNTNIDFNYAVFINETDFVVIGSSSKLSGDLFGDDYTFTDKAFIKRFTKGSSEAVWTKEYTNYYFSDIAVTETGKILAVGSSGLKGHAFLIQYDGDGKQLWKKDWKGDAGSLTVDAKNNYLVVGGNNILKFDSDGKQLWKKGWKDGAVTLTIDDENNYLVVGGNTISKLDSDGNQLWKKSVGKGYSLGFCIQDTDQNYVIVGAESTDQYYERFEDTGSKSIITKYSKDGEQLWKKEYKKTDDYNFSSVKALSGGGVVVAGSINNSVQNKDYSTSGSFDGIIIKYDSAGNIISKVEYGNSKLYEYFSDIKVVSLNGKDDIIIAVGGSCDWETAMSETAIEYAYTKALMVVFENDNVLYEHMFTGKDASHFTTISMYNNDWKNCVLIGSALDMSNIQDDESAEMFITSIQGFLLAR